MLKPDIAVDLDDVVLDFVGGIRRWVRTEYGVDIPESDIKDFNLRLVLDPIIGQNWWTAFRERDWIWSGFDAVPGAIGALEQLRREGYYLECVTSKPRWAEYATWKWLGKWRPPFNRVTIVGPSDSKVNFTSAPILIDDKYQNCVEFADDGRTALLFSRPHNLTQVARRGIIRVNDWAEALTQIKLLEESSIEVH